MIKWRLSDEPVKEDEDEDLLTHESRSKIKCTIFLGFTSNMISSGMREVIKYLCQHKMVDAIVTSTGAVEEDIMKCMSDHYLGDFKLSGKALFDKKIFRIGNMLVPGANYVKFESWFLPVLKEMH
jgi:deoxyhypusine synthase